MFELTTLPAKCWLGAFSPHKFTFPSTRRLKIEDIPWSQLLGIVPVKVFEERTRLVSAVRLEYPLTRVPVRRLFESTREVRRVSIDHEGGSGPWKPLLRRLRLDSD